MILVSLVVYLSSIWLYPDAFKQRPITQSHTELNGSVHHEPTPKTSVEKKTVDNNTAHSEPLINEDEKSFLRMVFLGVPNLRSPWDGYITIGVNVLLVLMSADMIFRGPLLHPETDLRFSRVGFVDSTSANVLVREPDSAQLPVYAYLAQGSEYHHGLSWQTVDRRYYLDSDTDYTYPVTFTNLQPSRSYTYSFSNNLTGTFTTAPSPTNLPASSHLTFLTSSCIKPQFPYDPFSHSLSIPGFTHLSTILQSLRRPTSNPFIPPLPGRFHLH